MTFNKLVNGTQLRSTHLWFAALTLPQMGSTALCPLPKRYTYMTKIVVSSIALFLIVSCATTIEKRIVRKELVLPKIEFEHLVKAKEISEEELSLLEEKYTAYEQEIPESKYDINELYMQNCIVIDETPQFENVVKLRIVGAEERWVPIEGKVTKVIHFRMSE